MDDTAVVIFSLNSIIFLPKLLKMLNILEESKQ